MDNYYHDFPKKKKTISLPLIYFSSLLFLQTSIVLRRKLHFTILNNNFNYILQSKLFDCMICILNYDFYDTLLHDVKFAINLDGNV